MLGVTLSLTDTIVAWVNITMVTVSVVVNWIAYHKGVPGLRVVHMAVSLVSVFYVIGYLWLLTLADDISSWSSVMRGVSILAWLVVWILPAVTSVRIWQKMQRAVMQEVIEICEREGSA